MIETVEFQIYHAESVLYIIYICDSRKLDLVLLALSITGIDLINYDNNQGLSENKVNMINGDNETSEDKKMVQMFENGLVLNNAKLRIHLLA